MSSKRSRTAATNSPSIASCEQSQQGVFFQQHPLGRGFDIITQASPLGILHTLPPRVTAFAILIVVMRSAVFIHVLGATVEVLQQRFSQE